MRKKRASSKQLTEGEKIAAVNAAKRKIFARLGMDPALSETKIYFGSHSELPADKQHEMAKAKGLQMGIEMAMQQLAPDFRTQEDLNGFLQSIDTAEERLPTLVREQMDKIRKEIPRRGGPGRELILNTERAEKVCDEIARYIREGYGVKQAIAETSSKARELIGKKVGTRTLEKAWSERGGSSQRDRHERKNHVKKPKTSLK